MGCGMGCLKCILIAINVIFGVIGLVLFSVGIFLYTGASKYLEPLLQSAFDKMQAMGGDIGVDAADYDTSGALDLSKFGEILNPVALCLLIIGLCLLFLCILGMVGVCAKKNKVLYVYAALVLALLVIQIVLVALFFTGVLDEIIKEKMIDKIQYDYEKTDAYDITSLTVNLMQINLQCCGIVDSTDFTEPKGKAKAKGKSNTNWVEKGNNKKKLNNAPAPAVGETKQTLDTPISCCKLDTTSGTCAVGSLSTLDNNYSESCWDKIQATLESFKKIMIGVLAGVLVLQAICVIAAIVIGVKLHKEGQLV